MASDPREIPLIFRLFWILPIVAGVLWGMTVLRAVQQGEASVQWQPVDATIQRVGGQKGLLRDQYWGAYKWEFAGVEYRGSEAACCGADWDDFFKANGEKKKGDVIVVYVNPDNPAQAVMMTGVRKACYLPLLVALGLVVAGWYVRKLITADVAGRGRGF